jgi:DNA-binding CsgD family transcriptional regulator
MKPLSDAGSGRDPATSRPDGLARPGGRLAALTPRELEVLALLSTGASTKEISHQLEITPSTVKRHLTNLYRKLGATNRIDAVRCYLLAELGGADPGSRQ